MPTTIDCQCGKKLKIPDHLAGKKVKCPGCGDIFAVPSHPPLSPLEPDVSPVIEKPQPAVPVSSPSTNRAMTSCPFCGETVLAAAEKCEHCQEMLNGQEPTGEKLEEFSSSKKEKEAGGCATLGIGCLALIVLGAVVIGIGSCVSSAVGPSRGAAVVTCPSVRCGKSRTYHTCENCHAKDQFTKTNAGILICGKCDKYYGALECFWCGASVKSDAVRLE